MKKQFKTLNDLYNTNSYFWRFGRYEIYIKIIKSENKPYLLNENTNEKIKGLKNINKYMKLNNLEVEE